MYVGNEVYCSDKLSCASCSLAAWRCQPRSFGRRSYCRRQRLCPHCHLLPDNIESGLFSTSFSVRDEVKHTVLCCSTDIE